MQQTCFDVCKSLNHLCKKHVLVLHVKLTYIYNIFGLYLDKLEDKYNAIICIRQDYGFASYTELNLAQKQNLYIDQGHCLHRTAAYVLSREIMNTN